MSTPTLLASLATRLATHPENIATEALLHLLRQHACAREAVASLIVHAGLPQLPEIAYRSQVTGDDGSIPDIVGFDLEGRPGLVLEAKFWADLTSNQPESYLTLVTRDVPAVLLFVVPEARAIALWDKIIGRVPPSMQLDGRVVESAGIKWAALANSGHLAIVSWRVLLSAVAIQSDTDGDYGCRADVQQLQGLCDHMDSEAFLPLRPGELSQEMGKRVWQLVEVVERVVDKLRGDPQFSTQGPRQRVSRFTYGQYFHYGPLGGCLAIIPSLWASAGSTPIWLSLKSAVNRGRWEVSPVAERVLRQLTIGFPSSFGEFEELAHIGIRLPVGRELSEVVDDVARQVREVCTAVCNELPPGVLESQASN